jgi:hypothetical protein
VTFTETDVDNLADKLSGMDLTREETAALAELITRAGDAEVDGFLQFDIRAGTAKLEPEGTRVGLRRALGFWETLPADLQT